jgi:hypothetical protein
MSPAIASSRMVTTLPDRFNRDLRYSQATPLIDVESSRLLGKNYECLLSKTRLVVCFQPPMWHSTCHIPFGIWTTFISLEKLFCRYRDPGKSAVRFHFSAENWSPFPAYGGQTIHVVLTPEKSGCVNKRRSRHVLVVLHRPDSP